MQFRHFRAPGVAGIIVLALSFRALSQGAEGDTTAIPRLGAEIDAYEREYFGLFPGIADFSGATVESRGSGVRFRVRATSARDSVFLLETEAETAAFGTYIDRFEENHDRWWRLISTRDSARRLYPQRQIARLEVRGIVSYVDNIAPDPPKCALNIAGGAKESGTVILLTDTSVVFHAQTLPARWDSLDTLYRVFNLDSVNSVSIYHPGDFLTPFLVSEAILGTIAGTLMSSSSIEVSVPFAAGFFVGMAAGLPFSALIGVLSYIGGAEWELHSIAEAPPYRRHHQAVGRYAKFKRMLPPELRSLLAPAPNQPK